MSLSSLTLRAATAADLDPYDPQWDELFLFQEHDYDPRWDYELRVDQLTHPLLIEAQNRLDELARGEQVPFQRGKVFPAKLAEFHGQGAVGVYCSGTYNEPVILIDLDAHLGYEDQVIKTLEHELVHAVQESQWDGEGDWRDEEQAEGWVFN